ncbi:DUF2303 family protein [Actinomadura scrupuli]|uniref:DUF2303 family protein n=1 Tax=Actinomadura scrupuli TaxID=559629 RepID=UPI003D9729D6
MSTPLTAELAGTRTENDAVIEAAIAQVEPHTLTDGEIYGYKLPGRVEVIDLDTEVYANRRERPRRKTGTVVVRNVASFAEYFGKHSDEDTEVYADLDAGTVLAVLNAHQPNGDAPRWEDHRLRLQLTPTLPWRRWIEKDRNMLPQVTFADFIDENLVDIDKVPVPAAEMLQVATTFQANTKGSYTSKINPSSGARSLIFEEDTTASSGSGKQTIPVPDKFAVLLAPFDDVDLYRMEARLRYRIESSGLKLGFFLDRPDDVFRAAVQQIVDQVAEATEAVIMRGAPA